MKRTVIAAALAAILSACSGDDPNAQLDKIDKLLGKGYPLTAEQVSKVTESVANGKRLLVEGKRKESSEQLAKAIKVLEKAGDADRFNKSE